MKHTINQMREVTTQGILDSAEKGEVQTFLKAVAIMNEIHDETILLTKSIFANQKENPFGSTPAEELQAAYREAQVRIEYKYPGLHVYEAAAVPSVKRKAAILYDLCKDEDDVNHTIFTFYKEAYELKLMFRT